MTFLSNISFKKDIPDDGHKSWPKHVGGYDVYNTINLYTSNIISNSARQYNHFITQGNYKAACFDYRLVILRPFLSTVSQDTMHTLGSHHVYTHGIHQINPSKAELNPICHLLALLGAHPILHVSRIRVKSFRPEDD